jgi:hypothetical protein
MQRLIGLLFLLTLSGCTYIVDFYIFNSTDSSITIEYQPRDTSEYEVFCINPNIMAFDKKDEFTELENSNEFQFDPETNTITCKLKSKQALWIGVDMNFSLDNEYAVEQLKERIVYLNISNGEKELNLTGQNIIDHLKKIKKHIIGIDIKKSTFRKI